MEWLTSKQVRAPAGSGTNHKGLPSLGSGALAVCLSPPPGGRAPPPGSGGCLPLWGIGTWTWEYSLCMGIVGECTTSIIVCLYVGCVGVSVFMCTHENGNV
ncbi:hypothetical protein ATANTOWER_022306 [Ataeniobius toweri]|uniref:Uncharacterized protein n=1 Tax=Ataeniobius toweri TaxID=208326 RepID=A0ABU7B9E2_9TELE|nr:hypothetical protein [Ataeniobius toweri]